MLGQEHIISCGATRLDSFDAAHSLRTMIRIIFLRSFLFVSHTRKSKSFQLALMSPFRIASARRSLTVCSSLWCKHRILLTLIHRFIGITLVPNITLALNIVNLRLFFVQLRFVFLCFYCRIYAVRKNEK